MGLVGLLVAVPPALAASISLQGQAVFSNTGGSLHFSDFNSNVTLDTDTGHLSGYSWSDDSGWVAFGTQDNEQGPVIVNLTTGAITGSAKVLATDTYITFTGNSSNLSLDTQTGQFTGYLFDPDMGWVEFGSSPQTSVVLAAALPLAPTPAPTSALPLPETGAALGLAAVVGWMLLGGGLMSRVLRKRNL